MEDITRSLEMILVFLCLLPGLYRRPLDSEADMSGHFGRAVLITGFTAAAGLAAFEIFRFGFGGKVIVPSEGVMSNAAFVGELIMLAVVGAFAVRRLF